MSASPMASISPRPALSPSRSSSQPIASGTYLDYSPFASDKFDANAYVNAVLAGQSYDPEGPAESSHDAQASGSTLRVSNGPREGATGSSASSGFGKGDTGTALSKLNHGIDEVTQELRDEIEDNHAYLLSQLSSSSHLSSQLVTIRSSLSSLDMSLSRLHTKIHQPRVELTTQVSRLEKLRRCTEVLRKVSRFLLLARRLETQMSYVTGATSSGLGASGLATPGSNASGSGGFAMKRQGSGDSAEIGTVATGWENEGNEREKEMAKAALTLAELDSLLSDGSARNLESVNSTAADGTTSHVDSEIPLASLHFVAVLAPTIQRSKETIVTEMESMVIRGLANLDQSLLSSSLQTAYNLRLLPKLVSNLLADLNDAVEDRIAKAFDGNSLAKEVAAKEQPSHTGASSIFIHRSRPRTDAQPTSQNMHIWNQVLWERFEDLMEDIAQCCIKVYTMEKILKLKKNPSKETDFLSEAMELLDEKPTFTFWTTLATSVDNHTRSATGVIQQMLTAGYPRFLRLLHSCFAKIGVHSGTQYTYEHQSPETVLILRAVSKLEGAYLARSSSRISESIAAVFSGWPKQPPSSVDGINVARLMVNELDAARFDPLLIRSVARAVAANLEDVMRKVEAGLIRDFSATSLIGPLANGSQINNAALINFLYPIAMDVSAATSGFGAKAEASLRPVLERAHNCCSGVIGGLQIAIKRDISAIMNRMHKINFSKPVTMGAGTSPYIVDLSEKLTFLRTELLCRFTLGPRLIEWVHSIVRHVIQVFTFHASISRPLGENGKLRLTTDMTELEFTLGTFMSTGQPQGSKKSARLEAIGEEYTALRSFRTMLFLDPAHLSHPDETVGLPPLVVLHHLIVLSPLQLPHQIHGWTEAEYALWVDKHTPTECWNLLEKAVDGQGDSQGAEEWRQLIKEVLTVARKTLE